MTIPSLTGRAGLAVALTLGVALSACDDDPVQPDPQNILETAASAGSFSTLLTAIEAAGLTATLSGDGPFTVFAPTDAAFAAVPQEALNALLQDPQALAAVLTYHVVAGDVRAADVVQLNEAQTVNGASIDIEVSGSSVTVDGVSVVQTDILASNGVIHVIDAVLFP